MTRTLSSAALLLAGLSLSAMQSSDRAAQCCEPAAADFPSVGGNLGNQSYSSLAQITRDNVTRLGGAWRVNLEPNTPPQPQQSTVVAVGGVLYVETTQGRVLAVDGASGAIKWAYAPGYGTSLRRGVAVGQGRVFTLANGKRVIALNKDTGAVIWEQTLDEPGLSTQMKVAVAYFDGMVYVGSNDSTRGAVFGLRADTGARVWTFYGSPAPGEFGHDTWEGDSWKTAGVSAWMHPAIDPELGLGYWTFGNARAGGAVNGATRGGTNLFANSLVALDLKTGQRRWHFQSVHHDIWDMDNVMAPVLAEATIDGKPRKLVIYGSKTALTYILDRATGTAVIGVEERPVPQEPSQKTWPTQPYPIGDSIVPICADHNAKGALRVPPHYPAGCLFTPHTDRPVVVSPGIGGGPDWSAQSFNPRTGLLYVGAGLVNAYHSIPTGGVGSRPPGQERSGRLVAKDITTNRIRWSREMPWSIAHGNGILSTAGDLLFLGQPDGYLLGLDIRDGSERWRFQAGAGVHTTPVTYLAGGVQHIAVFAGGNGLPYNSPRGDFLWGFKLGGEVKPAPAPPPPPMRQPVQGADAPVDGQSANFTVTLGRQWNAAKHAPDDVESSAQNAMAPTILAVPVGATVTFVNPATNRAEHCATQFFEGLFSIGPLQPGAQAQYTFTRAGEFFYHDCTNPQTTGKIVVR